MSMFDRKASPTEPEAFSDEGSPVPVVPQPREAAAGVQPVLPAQSVLAGETARAAGEEIKTTAQDAVSHTMHQIDESGRATVQSLTGNQSAR